MMNYNDIYLKPQKSIVNSRADCDTSVRLGKFTFKLPVYPANMKSVVDERTCEFLAKQGYFYTLHRFGVDILDFALYMRSKVLPVSISIGINSTEPLIDLYKRVTPDYITLDVANAWCEKTKSILTDTKRMFPYSFIIVGNIATSEAIPDLVSWGADAVKVGIAGGHVCTTKDKTGFYRPIVDTILDCADKSPVPIIADGGINTHGDIAKALSCGAHMVMAGYLFAGYDESAGDIIEINGKKYKEYFGSASEFNKEHKKNIEGRKEPVDYRGPMMSKLIEIQEDLQSAISYAGGSDLRAFNTKLIGEL